jgi:phosphoglycolate phosphatase
MKKLILWDLDGTLINTLEDLAAAVDYALELRGLPTHSIEEYRKMVGHGVRNLVKQALEASVSARPTPTHDSNARPTAGGNYFSQSFAKNQFPSAIATPTRGDASTGLTDAYIDSALADFREYYEAHIDVHTRPYPGIPELLNKLDAMGVKMAVASNKFQEGTEKLIQEFFPAIAFVSILGNRPGYPLKPDPEIVQEVLRKAGIGPEDAMMVGDSPTDMKTAANGGIDALAVTWGYRTQEELAGNRMVHTVEELKRYVLR